MSPRVPDAARVTATPVAIPASRLAPPILTWVGGRRWRLERAYAYRDDGTTITAPEGFAFDLSSVPRPLWWLIAPFELSIVAPLLHDLLYGSGGKLPRDAVEPYRTYSRREVDAMFLRIMRAEGVALWRRALAFAAVRTFGRSSWRTAPSS